VIRLGTGAVVAVDTCSSELASEAVAVISDVLIRESLECLHHESYLVEQIGVNEGSEIGETNRISMKSCPYKFSPCYAE
jgi:hypothetical protein